MGQKEIHGKKITIHSTTADDLPDVLNLWNNGEVMHYVGFPNGLGMNLNQMHGWLQKLNNNPDRHHYVVTAPEIGFCGEVYYRFERIYRRGELDIKLLPKVQGQGIASDAFRTLLNIVFTSEPYVDAVYVTPHNENKAALGLYSHYGFKPKPCPGDMKCPATNSYRELRREEFSDYT